jgi:hypothetical protein
LLTGDTTELHRLCLRERRGHYPRTIDADRSHSNTNARLLFNELDITAFFSNGKTGEQNSILAMQWDPDGNWLGRLDVTGKSTEPEDTWKRIGRSPSGACSFCRNDRFVVCSDKVLTMFTPDIAYSKIIDIGGQRVLQSTSKRNSIAGNRPAQVLETAHEIPLGGDDHDAACAVRAMDRSRASMRQKR